ncbi:MAG: hypothetical protein ACRDT0_06790 [Pseudonocardiaceae bacterium]
MTTAEVPTLVDSNVLLDVIREDPVWSSWSAETLGRVADEGPLVINPIIYAEASTTYATVEEFDAVLAEAGLARAQCLASRVPGRSLPRGVSTARGRGTGR